MEMPEDVNCNFICQGRLQLMAERSNDVQHHLLVYHIAKANESSLAASIFQTKPLIEMLVVQPVKKAGPALFLFVPCSLFLAHCSLP